MNSSGATQNDDFVWQRDSLGQWLRWVRLDRQLSQKRLEALSGVDDAEIHRIESGQTECRIETLLRLCGPLGVTAGWMLDQAVSANIGQYSKRLSQEPFCTALLERLGAGDFETSRPIIANLACACTLAAILLRCTLAQARIKEVAFPSDDLKYRFEAFAELLDVMRENVERATILSNLLAGPARELSNQGLLSESMLRDQLTDMKLPKAKRKSQSYGWSPWVNYAPQRKVKTK